MASEFPVSDMHIFTVDDLDRMFEVGILGPDERVELLEGRIVVRPRESPEHQAAVGCVHRELSAAYPWSAGYWIRLAATTAVDAYSLPEPDLSVLSGSPRGFATRHPRGSEVLLTVEVALAGVPRDRGQKAGIYARAGCPVYWVLDLLRRELVVHTGPRDDGTWASVRTSRAGEVVAPPRVAASVAVADLFPSA